MLLLLISSHNFRYNHTRQFYNRFHSLLSSSFHLPAFASYSFHSGRFYQHIWFPRRIRANHGFRSGWIIFLMHVFNACIGYSYWSMHYYRRSATRSILRASFVPFLLPRHSWMQTLLTRCIRFLVQHRDVICILVVVCHPHPSARAQVPQDPWWRGAQSTVDEPGQGQLSGRHH